ncbi:MAG TPA: DUF134 domain-containing protein [Bacteroidota bacterium]|nr:DUF134 domain-containing protein [Bacteroidota bacterium]
MSRPCKQRFVGALPEVTIFKPRGVPLAELEIVVLSLDELEAIRLADFESNQQEHAAAKMHISRPTFGRILDRAHRTVAEALLKGKAVRIEGGPVTKARREEVRCNRCRHRWEVPLPVAKDFCCPRCSHAHGHV